MPVQMALNFFLFSGVYTKVTYLNADIKVVPHKKNSLQLIGCCDPILAKRSPIQVLTAHAVFDFGDRQSYARNHAANSIGLYLFHITSVKILYSFV